MQGVSHKKHYMEKKNVTILSGHHNSRHARANDQPNLTRTIIYKMNLYNVIYMNTYNF